MDGPDEPPRVAMRRRMIRAIVDVATGPCDRWYILAHSLGTIVAWNGLMEIEEALPNYLSLDQWAQLGSSPLSARSPVPLDVNAMMPNRPVWLGRREIIDRIALFEKFRGLVTYGSPLERFCALWSNAVGINRDEFPFQAGVEWINVYRSGRDLDQRLRSARSAAKRACGSQAAQFPLSRIMARFVQSHSLPPGPTRAASPAGRRRQALAGQPDRGLAGARREPGVAARRGAEGRIDVLDAAQARRIGARLAGLSAGPLAHPAVDSCRLRADGAGVAVAPLRDLPSHERHSVVAKLSALLIEAACLWAAIGTVVVITSGIHYVFASRDLQDLKKRFEDQRQMRQPDDFQEASARKT